MSPLLRHQVPWGTLSLAVAHRMHLAGHSCCSLSLQVGLVLSQGNSVRTTTVELATLSLAAALPVLFVFSFAEKL